MRGWKSMGKLTSLIMLGGIGYLAMLTYKTREDVSELRTTVEKEVWYASEDRMQRFSDQIIREVRQMFNDSRYAEEVTDEEAAEEEVKLQPTEIYRYAVSRFRQIIQEEKILPSPDTHLIQLMEDQIKLVENACEVYQNEIIKGIAKDIAPSL